MEKKSTSTFKVCSLNCKIKYKTLKQNDFSLLESTAATCFMVKFHAKWTFFQISLKNPKISPETTLDILNFTKF